MHFRSYLHDISQSDWHRSHFNAQKHETIGQNIGEDIRSIVPNQIIGRHVPRPRRATISIGASACEATVLFVWLLAEPDINIEAVMVKITDNINTAESFYPAESWTKGFILQV